jgi:hypothetical protein
MKGERLKNDMEMETEGFALIIHPESCPPTTKLISLHFRNKKELKDLNSGALRPRTLT